jgi:hypothetical protein
MVIARGVGEIQMTAGRPDARARGGARTERAAKRFVGRI